MFVVLIVETQQNLGNTTCRLEKDFEIWHTHLNQGLLEMKRDIPRDFDDIVWIGRKWYKGFVKFYEDSGFIFIGFARLFNA